MRSLVAALLREVLPESCVACGRFGAALHDGCVSRLEPARGLRCGGCWRPVAVTGDLPDAPSPPAAVSPARCGACAEAAPGAPAVDGTRAAFRFAGIAHRAIVEAKFLGASNLLPPLARAAAAGVPACWAPDAVVAVPLARRRERHRGFNQALVVARVVAARLPAPLAPDLLRRVRETAPQAGLSASARRVNLRGAFEATAPAPSRVLLVDDVTTTRSTFVAAATALRAAGARRVWALALACED